MPQPPNAPNPPPQEPAREGLGWRIVAALVLAAVGSYGLVGGTWRGNPISPPVAWGMAIVLWAFAVLELFGLLRRRR